MRLDHKFKLDSIGARSLPPALLLLCVLAYGLLIPFWGFYWDDWPWIWLKHLEGGAGLLSIDRLFRPLAGEILWSAGLIAGRSPVAWQILSLVARFLAAAKTIEFNKFIGPMLCDTWQDILLNAPAGAAKDAAVQAVQARLNCPH